MFPVVFREIKAKPILNESTLCGFRGGESKPEPVTPNHRIQPPSTDKSQSSPPRARRRIQDWKATEPPGLVDRDFGFPPICVEPVSAPGWSASASFPASIWDRSHL